MVPQYHPADTTSVSLRFGVVLSASALSALPGRTVSGRRAGAVQYVAMDSAGRTPGTSRYGLQSGGTPGSAFDALKPLTAIDPRALTQVRTISGKIRSKSIRINGSPTRAIE